MISQILIAQKGEYDRIALNLFREYLEWGTEKVNQEFGLGFSADDTVAQDAAGLEKFMPPKGRLIMAFADNIPVGVACLKELSADTGEVKRMYVRPEYRSRGMGKALLRKLIVEAREIGYTCLRLDSARFMIEAHHLYRSIGFKEIGPYAGSEIPVEFHSHWVFMEMCL